MTFGWLTALVLVLTGNLLWSMVLTILLLIVERIWFPDQVL